MRPVTKYISLASQISDVRYCTFDFQGQLLPHEAPDLVSLFPFIFFLRELLRDVPASICPSVAAALSRSNSNPAKTTTFFFLLWQAQLDFQI
jgi:hypothetical protein